MTALDARVFYLFYAAANGLLTTLALALSSIGGGWIVVLLLPLLASPRWRRWAFSLAAALVASTTVVFALKFLVGRQRPCVALAGVHALCAVPTDPSFPSGHACGSFTTATFIVLVLYGQNEPSLSRHGRNLFAAILVLLAFGIAWSRVYLGVHFPIDVTVGALLGVLSGSLAAQLYMRSRARTRALASVSAPASGPPPSSR